MRSETKSSLAGDLRGGIKVNHFMQSSLFFGGLLTLAAYEVGLLIRRKWKLAIFNPLLIAIVLIIVLLKVCKIEYGSYQSGADYINYLLTPATVSLAIPLYQQLQILRQNFLAIFLGILAGAVSGMVSVLGLSMLFGLTHQEYVTLLPKSITTAIGMGVSQELGGVVTITVAVIVLTGVFGNIVAEPVLKFFRIKNPVAKGIGIGTAAHALGTAKAIEMGEIEGAMSGLSIVVSGVITVLAASFFAMLY